MIHIPPTPRYKNANNVWWKVIIMKLLTVQLSQAFHFLPLRSKYFPQHPILKPICKKQYQNFDLCIKCPSVVCNYNHPERGFPPAFKLVNKREIQIIHVWITKSKWPIFGIFQHCNYLLISKRNYIAYNEMYIIKHKYKKNVHKREDKTWNVCIT